MATTTTRALAALCLAAGALGAAAQPIGAGPTSAAEALDRLDRLAALRGVGAASDREPLPQVFVLPQRPGQNQVAWFDFDWHHLDVPSPSGGKGGIRLYFYAGEREVAELALPVVREAWLHLVQEFHYTPSRRIPYILYASRRAFQATNVFDVTEGVLGVTSPRDLKLSLPYLGDQRMFREVSTHELVHEFTIQKLLDLDRDETGSAIDLLPLWFIEGMAEYYAKGGLDPESDVYLRDLVWNPDPSLRYEIPSFEDDRHRGYIPTYKLGQARLTFVAEVYGKDKVQGFLEEAATLVHARRGERGFEVLVRRVLGEALPDVDTRWRAWLKHRYYPDYLSTRQDLTAVREVRDLPAEPESFAASPDGSLLLVRGVDRERARVSLHLVDAADPRTAVEVAVDGRPGVESLHPVEHSVMTLGDGALAFTAQSGDGDVLYVQRLRHEPGSAGRGARISLEDRRTVRVVHPEGRRFVELWDPALSPDGAQIAFVGFTESGQQDVYTVPVEGGTARQLTSNPFAKRDLAWSRDGAAILLASDATEHGRYNLFRLDAATGDLTRLTTGEGDDRSPAPRADGSILFTSTADGKPDLYVLAHGATRRLTDFVTGLTGPAPDLATESIWATSFFRGRFRLVQVPRVALLDEPPRRVAPPSGTVPTIPREHISAETPPYRPLDLSSWRPEAGAVYGGGSGYGVAGTAAVLFSDLLRDHRLLLDLSVWGSFDLTQALALYEDRSRRTSWVLGAYHFVQQQIDPDDASLSYLQRNFGALGMVRHPLDRFQRFETELSVSGIQRYCLTDFVVGTLVTCGGTTAPPETVAAWRAANGGINPQLGPTVRYGYDTVRYDLRAGPIAGDALLLELGGGWLPGRSAVHGFARVDAVHYWRILGRAKLVLRVAAGSSFAPSEEGRLWARTWWLTSADNLRGYGPFDLPYLIGRHYYVGNAELHIPLDPLIRLFLLDSLYGVVGLDFGSVFTRWSARTGCVASDPACAPGDLGPWDNRTLTLVLGTNFMLGPLLLRVHFGHPFDIGGVRTPALQAGTSWVTNVTLRYAFL